jgi:YfiH family protein
VPDPVIRAANFEDLGGWLIHGFGLKDSELPPRITTVHQIHSGVVLDAAGRTGDRIADADALISNQPGITVGVRTADCVPILVVDPLRRAVAVIHAGWRGTARQITMNAVLQLQELWGSRPENLRAAIGPSIGVCCFETGPEVARQFGIETNRKTCLDLPAINERQLRAVGVENIWQSGECTFCAPERFFSYRRNPGEPGRMISFVGVISD